MEWSILNLVFDRTEWQNLRRQKWKSIRLGISTDELLLEDQSFIL